MMRWVAALACACAGLSLEVAAAARANPLVPDAVNDELRTDVIGPRASAAAILRAQVLLERANFSPGEIDGIWGSGVRTAIAGFQKRNGLKITGATDAPTWAALNRDNAPALVAYTISDADLAGPFTPVPEKMEDKATLPALGYASAEEALGEKFHASPKLLARLNPGKDFTRVGEQIVVPSVESIAPITGAEKLIVDKSDSTVALVDAQGNTIAQFPASMGSQHDPLPLGNWKIKGVGRNPVFRYNPQLFWDAEPGDEKAVIPAGPNNPVGVVWIDLTKDHYGIHGTPEPSQIRRSQSHGCIRMTNWSAQILAAAVKPGMPALLQP